MPKGSNTIREIPQSGLECVGNVDDGTVVDVIRLALECLAVFQKDFVLEVSHLQIVSAFLDLITRDFDIRDEILFKMSEKNQHSIRELAAKYELDKDAIERLIDLMKIYGKPERVVPKLKSLISKVTHEELPSEVERLINILDILADTDHADRVRVDFSLVGDMKYYNGLIFKGFIKGIPDRLRRWQKPRRRCFRCLLFRQGPCRSPGRRISFRIQRHSGSMRRR